MPPRWSRTWRGREHSNSEAERALRVLILDPNNDTPYYDHSLCVALRDLECDVELLTSRFAYDEVAHTRDRFITHHFYKALCWPPMGRIPFHRSRIARRGVKALEHPVDLLRFLRYVWARRPDLVHFQWVAIPPLDYLAFRALREMGIPVVYTIHDLLPDGAGPWSRIMATGLYGGADVLIAHSHWAKRQLRSRFDVPPHTVRVIPCGNLDLFRSGSVPRAEARTTLGLPHDAPVALFFGIIKPYKGLRVLIEAFAQVRSSVPNARLVIAGRPSQPFCEYQEAIDRLGIGQAVKVDLRFVPQSEASAYFSACDVVVLPYLHATTSHVLMMAYTFARPTVATTAGGIPEAVVDGSTGYVVAPADSAALAEAISAILTDQARAQRMGDYARHLADTVYSWPAIGRATLAVYQACQH